MAGILVIGGDRLGKITDKLADEGYDQIHHITGRKSSEIKVKIPAGTELVLVFTDFVNHNLSKVVKSQAKQQNVPVMFCKRSSTALTKILG